MTDLRFYFDGTNGTPVNGEVLLDVMISKEEKPKDIGQLKFRYSDSFFLHSACSYDHELAIMSGNVLLPLLYYSFKTQGEYLWSLYCKRSGVKKLYEIKLALFSALMNKDIDSAIEQTHQIMDVAKNDLGFYGA